MDKTALLRYFTIAMIALFVAEILFIGIQSGDGGTPTPVPTPSPAVAPVEAFDGTALAFAEVAGLGDELLVRCNASNAAGVVRAVDGVSGISADPASALLDVSLYRGTDALAVSRSLYGLLGDSCELSVLRFSFLSFNGSVDFASAAENKTRSIPARALDCFADRTGRCFALVSPTTRQGEKIEVSMFLRLVNNRIERLLVQQQETSISSFKQVSAQGRVVSLGNSTAAFSQIAWEDRDINRSQIEAAVAPASVNEFNYFPDSSVMLPMVGNETITKLGNLSFVKLVSPRENNTLLFVEDNFTDKQAVVSALPDAGINVTPEFPPSSFSVSFEASNASNFSSVKSALEALLNSSVELRRQADVELQDVPFLETQLGASFGNNTMTRVLVDVPVQQESILDLQLSVFVMLGEVSSFYAAPAPAEAEPTPSSDVQEVARISGDADNATTVEKVQPLIDECAPSEIFLGYGLGVQTIYLEPEGGVCNVRANVNFERSEFQGSCRVPLEKMKEWTGWKFNPAPGSFEGIAEFCSHESPEATPTGEASPATSPTATPSNSS